MVAGFADLIPLLSGLKKSENQNEGFPNEGYQPINEGRALLGLQLLIWLKFLIVMGFCDNFVELFLSSSW